MPDPSRGFRSDLARDVDVAREAWAAALGRPLPATVSLWVAGERREVLTTTGCDGDLPPDAGEIRLVVVEEWPLYRVAGCGVYPGVAGPGAAVELRLAGSYQECMGDWVGCVLGRVVSRR